MSNNEGAYNTRHGRRVFSAPKDLQLVLDKKYFEQNERRKDAFKKAIPFIGPEFDGVFSLVQGLILVCAKSGNAKSTTAANVLAGFLNHSSDGKAIVISNEDMMPTVYNRIACVMLKTSFNQYQKRLVSEELERRIEQTAIAIKNSGRIVVIDFDGWDMTVLEDVIGVLDWAAKEDARLVVLDYLQTVNVSSKNTEWDSIRVSKELGFYLCEYGKRSTVPVVVFAQLKPSSETPDIISRIQNDKTIYNHAFSVVEVVPDFKTLTTNFIIHKDRFGGSQGKTVTMRFDNGKYEALDL